MFLSFVVGGSRLSAEVGAPAAPLCPAYDPDAWVNYCVDTTLTTIPVVVPDPSIAFDDTVEICIAPPAPCVFVPTLPNVIAKRTNTDIQPVLVLRIEPTVEPNTGEATGDVCEILTGNRNCLRPDPELAVADVDGNGAVDGLVVQRDDGSYLLLPFQT